ncbi:MAG: hypothetical protein ACFFE4_03900 [Candidatus Thorarchaeota archaeon]
MADIFNDDSLEKNPNEYLCVVYVLYFDEKKGQLPLLMYPDDRFRSNKKYMRPIHYHPVWFLETEDLDHIDLEYKGYTFFGKKFLTKSDRKKRRAGLESETPETIVLIVSLPIELAIFGDDLIRALTEELRNKFEDQFTEVIQSEIARDTVIKTPKIQDIISRGSKIKIFIRELIDKVVKEYFLSVIQKKSESPSLKTQRAISYFSLKGFELSPLSNLRGEEGFSTIALFDPAIQETSSEIPLSIKKINIIENSQEIEIIMQNNSNEELKHISITITHVKEFFEKEVMTQEIEFWFPQEELLFVSPIIPHIEEYLVSVEKKDNDGINQKILNQRIDINLIDKIKQ